MKQFVKQVKQIRKQQIAVCFAMGNEQTVSFTYSTISVPVAIRELFFYTEAQPSWFKAHGSDPCIREFESLRLNYSDLYVNWLDEETFNLRIPVQVRIGPYAPVAQSDQSSGFLNRRSQVRALAGVRNFGLVTQLVLQSTILLIWESHGSNPAKSTTAREPLALNKLNPTGARSGMRATVL